MLIALFVSLVAAVFPTIIYALAFYWADRYEREPLWMLSVAFLWGAVPAIAASLIGEVIIGTPLVNAPGSVAEAIVGSVIVAPVVEEIAKGLALWAIFLAFRQEFDGVLDGLTYGALIGFGFAMTENFLYFVGAFSDGGYVNLTAVIFLRAVVFGLNHAFYTGLFGIGLGLARRTHDPATRRFWGLAGLLAAMGTHALHNLGASLTGVSGLGLLLSLGVAFLGFALVVVAFLLAWRQERRWLQEELQAEIGLTLTADEYRNLLWSWRRPLVLDGHQDRRRAERMRLNVELAFRKHRVRTIGLEQEPELAEEVQRIRRRIASLVGPPG